MTDAFTFDPDITFSPDHDMTLTGTAASFVSKVEIFEGTKDLGSAQISNGSWSFTHDIGTSTSPETFSAKVDALGSTASFNDQTIALSNIKGNPFTSATETLGNSQGIAFKMYSSNGDLEYHASANGNSATLNFTETGDQAHTQFVFLQDSNAQNIAQKITNFHVDGNSHDTVLLPHADFANMADLLRNTTMSGGNAVIHDPNNGATLTLMGVTKTEMKAHPHDFAFHGSGQISSS